MEQRVKTLLASSSARCKIKKRVLVSLLPTGSDFPTSGYFYILFTHPGEIRNLIPERVQEWVEGLLGIVRDELCHVHGFYIVTNVGPPDLLLVRLRSSIRQSTSPLVVKYTN